VVCRLALTSPNDAVFESDGLGDDEDVTSLVSGVAHSERLAVGGH